MTDAELMELVKDDQLDYLRDIYERYAPGLHYYFQRMTGDEMISDDLTHTVFEKIIRSRHTYEDRSNFKGWLFRIAKNSLMEHYRHKQASRETKIEDLDIAEPISESEGPSEEQKNKLSKALDRIKSEHREVLLLTRFENLDYKEAAAVIGISETGVKSRVFRAIKSLRRAYYEKTS